MQIRTVGVMVACAVLVGGCAPQPSAAPVQIIKTRCTKCHNTDRIKAAQFDEDGWSAIIWRMRGQGAQLTDAEAKAVIGFLAGGGGAGL